MNIDILEPVLATLLGFIAAFFAEPVKTAFLHRQRVQNLRKALYKEILSILDSIYIYLDASRNESIDLTGFSLDTLMMSDFEAYKFAMSEPLLFYELPESQYINRIYKHLQLFKSLEREYPDPQKRIYLSEKYIELILTAFTGKEFDKKLLRKMKPKKRRVIKR
jgi:hypothetical protein